PTRSTSRRRRTIRKLRAPTASVTRGATRSTCCAASSAACARRPVRRTRSTSRRNTSSRTTSGKPSSTPRTSCSSAPSSPATCPSAEASGRAPFHHGTTPFRSGTTCTRRNTSPARGCGAKRLRVRGFLLFSSMARGLLLWVERDVRRERSFRRRQHMNLIRWSPRLGSGPRDLVTFQDEVNRLFDGFLGSTLQAGENGILAPPVDVEETPEEFVVRADLPGVPQKDVKVSLMGDTLTIR